MLHRTPVVIRMICLTLLAALLPLAGGCATDKQVISQAAQAHTGLQPAVVTDPQLSSYLQQVGNRVIASGQQLYQAGYGPAAQDKKDDSSWMFSNAMQFHLVASKEMNAFTTGGEHMYVYTELFETCKNEDELAAVMAHEYAHVYSRHVAKGMNRQTYAMIGAGAAGAAGYAYGGKDNGTTYASTFASAAAAGLGFANLSFTRGDESQADEVGFQFYVNAGWDPNRFSGFFKTLIAKGYDTSSALTSDHPTLASRVEQVNLWVAKLPPQSANLRKPDIANDAQFKALQTRATQVVAAMPKSDAQNKAQLMLASFPSCVSQKDAANQQAARNKLNALLQQPSQGK